METYAKRKLNSRQCRSRVYYCHSIRSTRVLRIFVSHLGSRHFITPSAGPLTFLPVRSLAHRARLAENEPEIRHGPFLRLFTKARIARNGSHFGARRGGSAAFYPSRKLVVVVVIVVVAAIPPSRVKWHDGVFHSFVALFALRFSHIFISSAEPTPTIRPMSSGENGVNSFHRSNLDNPFRGYAYGLISRVDVFNLRVYRMYSSRAYKNRRELRTIPGSAYVTRAWIHSPHSSILALPTLKAVCKEGRTQ